MYIFEIVTQLLNDTLVTKPQVSVIAINLNMEIHFHTWQIVSLTCHEYTLYKYMYVHNSYSIQLVIVICHSLTIDAGTYDLCN